MILIISIASPSMPEDKANTGQEEVLVEIVPSMEGFLPTMVEAKLPMMLERHQEPLIIHQLISQISEVKLPELELQTGVNKEEILDLIKVQKALMATPIGAMSHLKILTTKALEDKQVGDRVAATHLEAKPSSRMNSQAAGEYMYLI